MMLGQTFEFESTALWSAPCLACGRNVARKRAYKGEQPCTAHAPRKGFEVQHLRAEVVELTETYVGYRVITRLRVDNPMPGTTGRQIDSGGMTRVHFDAQVRQHAIRLVYGVKRTDGRVVFVTVPDDDLPLPTCDFCHTTGHDVRDCPNIDPEQLAQVLADDAELPKAARKMWS